MINHEYHPKYGKILEDCIRFSRNIPLSISFAYDISLEALGNRCVQALGSCVYRWKDIKIVDVDLTTALFSSIPKDTKPISEAPKLRHLFVTGDPDSDFGFHVAVESAPSLVQLSLWSLRASSTALQGLDWSKIAHFEVRLTEFQLNDISTMLKRMPNLVSLTKHGPIGERSSITTGDSSIRVGTNILDILTAPRLKKLDIEWGTDWPSLVRFLRRSQYKIEEVNLTGTGIHDSWHGLLFDNIKTLFWETPFAARYGFEHLKYRNTPSESDLFPGLENLHIVGLNCSPVMDEGPWSVEEVIDMLKSHLLPQQTEGSTKSDLKCVRLEFVDLKDEHVVLLTSFANSDLVRSSGVQMHISSLRSGITFLSSSKTTLNVASTNQNTWMGEMRLAVSSPDPQSTAPASTEIIHRPS